MRKVIALVLATTAMLAASIAAADTTPIAVAVNTPTSWQDGSAYGGTGYVGLGKRHGVRVNAASYAYSDRADAFVAALSSDGIESTYSGRIHDVSIGWQLFSRGLWDGASLEVDTLVRTRDTRIDESFWANRIRDTASTTYAGRVMVGWSWLIQKRLFFAVSVGLSHGIEKGTETRWAVDDTGDMTTIAATNRLDRTVVAGEGFVRIGLAFGR